jgi:O-antigen/teichoic acid export membrane protein
MYRFLILGSLIQFLGTSGLILLALPLLPAIASLFQLNEWIWLLPWYLGVGILQLTGLSLSQSLECLFWQKEAQYTLALGSLVKLVGVLLAVAHGGLDLSNLVIVLGLAEGLTVSLLILSAYRRWLRDERRTSGKSSWWKENSRRVTRYGLWAMILKQSNLLYGSGPNRLAAAHCLTAPEVALVGAADTLAALVRRFLPAQMLMGIIRPAMLARFSSGGDFAHVARVFDVVYRINATILLLPAGILFIAGEPFFGWLTNEKYGTAASVLAGFLILMMSEGLRTLLELMVQAVEKNQIFVLTNLIQSASLVIAIPLFGHLGPWAIIVANILGTVTANVIVVRWLRGFGYDFSLDAKLLLRVLAYAGSAWVVCWGMLRFAGPVVSAVAAVGVYAVMLRVWPPLRDDEMMLFRKLFVRKALRPREGE